MLEKLYRLEKLYTTGWEVVSSNLTKSQAQEQIENLLNQGDSPDSIKVIRES